jgi:hypothetical protein
MRLILKVLKFKIKLFYYVSSCMLLFNLFIAQHVLSYLASIRYIKIVVEIAVLSYTVATLVFLTLWFNFKIQSVISFMRSMCCCPVYFCGAVHVSFCCAVCRCHAISVTPMPQSSTWQKPTSEPKTAGMKGKKYNKQICFLHTPTFGTDHFILLCGHKIKRPIIHHQDVYTIQHQQQNNNIYLEG